MAEGDPFINILLLGETGVGKSTFINSIINYLTYCDFKKAQKENLVIVIPLKFTVQDKHGEYRVIQAGGKDDQNECLDTGMSATQDVKSYIFPIGNGEMKIRLIDTPGIGDVRGIDQDNINCENILSYIEQLDKLHAICYLFKPTHSRFTVYFQYCLSQILSRLEKSVSNNIIFIFTNTRGTHYGPGDTFPNLEKFIDEIKSKHDVDIPLGKNMFCFDNEGFRYLVSSKQGVQFDDFIRKRNRESWDRSVQQCSNLIRYITGDYENHPLEPYFIKDTSTINGVRRLIVQFSKLLSETSQLISDNVCTLQRHTDDLDSESHRLNELKETLYIPVTKVLKTKLNQPEMVCASKKCMEIYKVGDSNEYHYKQVCQSPCYLSDTLPEIIGSPELLNCEVIDSSTKACKICGCDFSAHMQVYYSTQKRESKLVDNNVKKDFDCKEKCLRYTENLITKYIKENDELEKEYKTILQVCTRFADFLKRKVIVPFCDSYEEYTEYLILQEKSLGVASNASKVQHLQKLLQEYEPVKQLFSETLSLEKNIREQDILITPQYIQQKLKELYDLKYHGSKIREIKVFNANENNSTEYDVDALLHYPNNGNNVTKNTNTNEFLQSKTFYNSKGEFAVPDMGKDYSRRKSSSSETRSVTRANNECDLHSINQWQAQDNLTDKFQGQNSDNDQFSEQHKSRSRMRGRGRGQWHNRYRNQSQTQPGTRNQRQKEDKTKHQSLSEDRKRRSPTETQSITRESSECDSDSRNQWQAEDSVADRFQFEYNTNDELQQQPRSQSRMRGRGRGQRRNRYTNHSETQRQARTHSQTEDRRDQSQSQDRESDQQSQIYIDLNPKFQGQGNIPGNRARGRGRGQWPQNRVRNQSVTTTENCTKEESQFRNEGNNQSQMKSGLRGRWQGRGRWVKRRGRNQFQPLAKSQMQTESQKESPARDNEKNELQYPNRENNELQFVNRSDSPQSYTREVGGNSHGKIDLQKDNISKVTNFNLTQKDENMFKRQTNRNFASVNYDLSPKKTIDNQYCDNMVKKETNHNLPQITTIGQVQFDSKGRRYISERDLSPSLKTGSGRSYNPSSIRSIKKDELQSISRSDFSQSCTREVGQNSYGKRDLQTDNVSKVTNFNLTQMPPLTENRENTVKRETNHNFTMVNQKLPSKKTVNNQPQMPIQNSATQVKNPYIRSTYNEVGLDANRYFETPRVRQNFVTNRVVSPNYNRLQNQSYHQTSRKSEKCCLL